ncbi:hypothetical protein Taro_017236 [Colocasia esculenta]|uniref:Fcf2 pre-rRNA processing C-terminal domain-containing protein n=1 Tax=Colocasia esculenta TaxID=4460 RepID=A0A843UMJ2_COLES|nr:hypothetical protein [Colocasia esculenta]
MAENKSTIGLSWAPRVPSLTCGRRTTSEMVENLPQVSAWKNEGELVDGLFVPSRDPRKLNKLLKKSMKDTTGKSWFDMPAPTISPDIKKDLEILKVCHYYVDSTIDFDFDSVSCLQALVYIPAEKPHMVCIGRPCDQMQNNNCIAGASMVMLQLRSAIDPKRHYKKGDTKSKILPKYFQMGTVVESTSDFFSGRLTKKERKQSLADELLCDQSFKAYRKRKVREIDDELRPAGVDKWRIRGRQTLKRAKERRVPRHKLE